MTSTSPDNKTCTAIELAVMLITSPSIPFFFNSPRSSTTQIGVWAGLEPDQAILKRSPAEAYSRLEKITMSTSESSDMRWIPCAMVLLLGRKCARRTE
jgi:hypothetical protein